MFFDMGPMEIVALVVLAVLVFGPDKLPKLISDAMAMLRKVREFSDSAKADIRKELGPEYEDFEFEDLHPKNFVRKQLTKHGDGLGLDEFKELKELRDDFARDAAEASAAIRSVRRDPLGKVAPLDEEAPAAAAAAAGASAPAATSLTKAAPAAAPAAVVAEPVADDRPPFDLDAT